jgi:hypothetical protein
MFLVEKAQALLLKHQLYTSRSQRCLPAEMPGKKGIFAVYYHSSRSLISSSLPITWQVFFN